ncbi:hypothetical protein CRM22_000403 [Opisthorchis felineus]|uniref:Uncharacterized protein n=1 Tax=Opisthorchis felineus TaxID=147828 RepID=A0A4V3SHA9_OPIFE|nr:hypothetical protein CRM22_000403 [Opisthorchis felineus]
MQEKNENWIRGIWKDMELRVLPLAYRSTSDYTVPKCDRMALGSPERALPKSVFDVFTSLTYRLRSILFKVDPRPIRRLRFNLKCFTSVCSQMSCERQCKTDLRSSDNAPH